MASPGRSKSRKDKDVLSGYEALLRDLRVQLTEQQQRVEQRAELRSNLLLDFQELFRRRAEAELEYAHALKRIAERITGRARNTREQSLSREQAVPSVAACWHALLKELRQESQDHAALGDLCLHALAPRCMQLTDDTLRVCKKVKEVGQKLQEELLKYTGKLHSVTKIYQVYHGQSQAAEAKFQEAAQHEELQLNCNASDGGKLSPTTRVPERLRRRNSLRKIEKLKEKRQVKFHDSKVKSIKARNEYILTLEAINASVKQHFVMDVSDIINCCDLGYHPGVASVLSAFLLTAFGAQTSHQSSLGTLQEAVNGLDQPGDKKTFLEAHRSTFHPAPPLKYEPHMGDEKFSEFAQGRSLTCKLQAKRDLMYTALGKGMGRDSGFLRPPVIPMKPPRTRKHRLRSQYTARLFNGDLETFIRDSGQAIPLVVESCIRYINLHGLQHQGIFRVSGSQVDMNEIRQAFERGEDPLAGDAEMHDINSVAGVLKLYFRELEQPLVPLEAFFNLVSAVQLEDPGDRAAAMCKSLCSISPSVLVVMRFLFAFLNHLSQFSDENMMGAYNLAICFGPTLMPAPDDQDQVSIQAQVSEVIKSLILQHDQIFPGSEELSGPTYENCMTSHEEYCDAQHGEGILLDMEPDGSTETHSSEDESESPWNGGRRCSDGFLSPCSSACHSTTRTLDAWWQSRLGGVGASGGSAASPQLSPSIPPRKNKIPEVGVPNRQVWETPGATRIGRQLKSYKTHDSKSLPQLTSSPLNPRRLRTPWPHGKPDIKSGTPDAVNGGMMVLGLVGVRDEPASTRIAASRVGMAHTPPTSQVQFSSGRGMFREPTGFQDITDQRADAAEEADPQKGRAEKAMSLEFTESLAQDIEETLNSALQQLRELEQQSSTRHAPDLVLDTLAEPDRPSNVPEPLQTHSPSHLTVSPTQTPTRRIGGRALGPVVWPKPLNQTTGQGRASQRASPVHRIYKES
uniref:SLIT-ROBO Rho GTPase-activating protein 1-like isoform X2 n=1 Tax=Myxine glutinosa TaxID=7769 RepID=UPI00358E0B77